jgi:hypothetical protein
VNKKAKFHREGKQKKPHRVGVYLKKLAAAGQLWPRRTEDD